MRVLANVAAGNIEGVAQDWLYLPPTHQGKGLEIVLQAHTLAGFPRTINALIKIQEVGLHPEGKAYYDEVHDLKAWNKAGHETLRTVYGPVSEKMLKNFSKMHPLLELILVEHIYGRVLSRSLVDLRIRELCSLSIIAGQNLPVQLVSSNTRPRITDFSSTHPSHRRHRRHRHRHHQNHGPCIRSTFRPLGRCPTSAARCAAAPPARRYPSYFPFYPHAVLSISVHSPLAAAPRSAALSPSRVRPALPPRPWIGAGGR